MEAVFVTVAVPVRGGAAVENVEWNVTGGRAKHYQAAQA